VVGREEVKFTIANLFIVAGREGLQVGENITKFMKGCPSGEKLRERQLEGNDEGRREWGMA